jgi:TolA-binding protein
LPHFKEMGCLIDKNNDVNDSDIDIEMLDEEKMIRLLLDGLAALRIVQREKEEKRKDKSSSGQQQHESAKDKVFAGAISMIMDDDKFLDADPALANHLLPFPDKNKMADGRFLVTSSLRIGPWWR